MRLAAMVATCFIEVLLSRIDKSALEYVTDVTFITMGHFYVK